MISLENARTLIAESVRASAALTVPLGAARGLVLARDVAADGYYPSGDRSQMDGYVVGPEAVPGTFRVASEIQAGAESTAPLHPGETFRIFTGALLPPGGTRVIMQEDVRKEGDTVHIPIFGERLNVRRKGAEAVPGDVLLPSGTRLGAAELAILAQVGCVHPTVFPAPAVRHLATGGELVDPASTPGAGQIRDTNTSLLRALFAAEGVTAFESTRVPDDPDALLQAAETDAALLILSGGASVGDYDFSASALRRLGYTIHFDRVNLRPGKPLTFATRGSQPAFILPGNPASHFVCYHLAVKLAVELAAGRQPSWPAVWLPLKGGEPLQQDPRETWWPARTAVQDGILTVSPMPWSSSGNTFSLSGTNALVQVNAGSPDSRGHALTLLLDTPGH